MTAKPSPVSLTLGQQPRSPTPAIYTAAAPRWDAGQGAWLGYLGGDPPPTPKKREKSLSTRSQPPAPQPSSSPLTPLPLPALGAASAFLPLAFSALPLVPSHLLLSFPSPPDLFSFLVASPFLLFLPFVSTLCFAFSAHLSHSSTLSPSALSLPFRVHHPLAWLSVSLFSPFSVFSLSPQRLPLSF